MHTIVETLAAEVDASVRPYLAIVVAIYAGRAGLDPETPHVLGRFAAALHPAGPDDKLRATTCLLARVIDEQDIDEASKLWKGLKIVGIADAVSRALDIAPSYVTRLMRIAAAARGEPAPSVH